MQKAPTFAKAWLKVSYKENTYLPVTVLKRTSQLRTLICDGDESDPKKAYEVQQSVLIPRGQSSKDGDLLEMEFPNVPEIQKNLSQAEYYAHGIKYKCIGDNLLIDIAPPEHNTPSPSPSPQLQNFYKAHLNTLLSNTNKKQQLIIIASRGNLNPHCYVNPFLELLARTTELWPHKAKIEKLGVVMGRVFGEACLEIKFGFLQKRGDVRASRRTMFVHLKPYLPVCPSEGLLIPEQLIGLTNNKKFSQMYKGPSPTSPETAPSELQALIDAFLSLGIAVKQIHSLMRLLALIANFNQTYIEEQIQGSADSQYITYHLQSEREDKLETVGKIRQILDLEEDRLESLFVFGEADHVAEKLTQKKQKLQQEQKLGSKKQLANYRLHILKYLLYQIFLTRTCDTLNRALCSNNYLSDLDNTEYNKKCLILLSFGTAKRSEIQVGKMRKELMSTMFWGNGREMLVRRLEGVVRRCVVAAVVGVDGGTGSQGVVEVEGDRKEKEQGKKQKPYKPGTIDKKQTQLTNLSTFISYKSSIETLKSQLLSPTHSPSLSLQYKQTSLLDKEQALHSLYLQLSNSTILSQIQMQLYKTILKGELSREVPYSMYQYVWMLYEEWREGRDLYTRDVCMVVNGGFVRDQDGFVELLGQAIHKRNLRVEMDGDGDGGVQMALGDFADRYLYTELCKKQIHRKYPQKIRALPATSSKPQKISASSPYTTHKETLQLLSQSTLQYIETETPKTLTKTHKKTPNKKQQINILITDSKEFHRLEEEVERQQRGVERIERQWRVFRDRKRTLGIVFRVKRERDLERVLGRLGGLLRKRVGIYELREYVKRKEKEERERIQRARELLRKDEDNEGNGQGGGKGSQGFSEPYAQTMNQPLNQPLNQSGQTLNQPMNQSGQPLNQPLNQSGQTLNQPLNQSGQPMNQPLNQSGQPMNQPMSQPMNQSGQPKSQPMNQPLNQSGQPLNQPLNQSGQTLNQPMSQPLNQSGQPLNQPMNQSGQTLNPPSNQSSPQINLNPPPSTTNSNEPQFILSPPPTQSSSPQPLSNTSKNNHLTVLPPPAASSTMPSKLTSKENPHFLLSHSSKKNQNQFMEKSQNLEELTKQELLSIKDHPSVSLQQWQHISKLKFLQIRNPEKPMFTKYASLTQRLPIKEFEYPRPSPDQQILQRFIQDDYLDYLKGILDCKDVDKEVKMLSNQRDQIQVPLIKEYPIKEFPNFYKEAFNAILKIGLEKNSSKPVHQLMNIFVVPLIETYYKELTEAKMLFDEDDAIPSDYSSNHNILKDEVFLYFAKQITSTNPQKFPQKNNNAYLTGLSYLTRFFCPSPKFLYPMTTYIYFLYKSANQKQKSQEHRDLLQSVFENLLFFIEATEGFKRNSVRAFVEDKTKPIINKSEAQCAGYLHPRKIPIQASQINKPLQGKKLQPPVVTIWLINNESFTFPVRNEIVKTLKKKVLAEIGYVNRQQCFNLYFSQPDYSYTLIDDKQKALNLFPLMQIYKQKKLRRPIYLRITHYFPFILKDINTTRLVYLNMISDELTFPFTPEQYQFAVAQSMAYEDYQEVRIGNYLIFTGQQNTKTPNMKPVEEKFQEVAKDANKKVCEFQYMKFIKNLGFLLAKCYQAEDDPDYIISVRPNEVTLYKAKKVLTSIDMKRIKNVYYEKKKIVLEIQYKNCIPGQEEPNQRMRTLTIQHMKRMGELFRNLLFYLENRMDLVL